MNQRSTWLGIVIAVVALAFGYNEVRTDPSHTYHLTLAASFLLLAIVLILNDDERFFKIGNWIASLVKQFLPWKSAALIVLTLTALGCTLDAHVAHRPATRATFANLHAAAGVRIVPACVAVQVIHATNDEGAIDTLPALAIFPCPDPEPPVDTTASRGQ